MSRPVLTRAELNRAALSRQLLLDRGSGRVVDVVHSIGGLNAQTAKDPYLALHCRLGGFTREELTSELESGQVVRSCLHRATQHLVTAADFAWLHPTIAPVLARAWRGVWRKRVDGVDIDALLRDARDVLADRVMTRPVLGRELAASRPGADATALGWTVQYLLPTIHPAPAGVWGASGAVAVRLADHLAGTTPEPTFLVRQYLAAFGPATTSDMRVWCGVPGLRETVATMRDELVEFRDESGRTLYDLPGAPRPAADTPAPVRLLAGFDNLLLAYNDRTRVMTDEIRARVCVGDLIDQVLLVDGYVAGTWRLHAQDGLLTIQPFIPLADDDAEAARAEGARLLAFATEPPGGDVRIEPPT